jgi:exoribonuclease-2
VTEQGVVLGFQQIERTLTAVVLDSTGKIITTRLTDISLAYSPFVPIGVAAQAGLQNIPETEQQIPARVAILKKLRKLLAAASRASVDVMQRGDLLYGAFASRESHEHWGRMTLDDALRFIFGAGKPLRMHHAIAMKTYLLENPEQFVVDAAVPSLLQSRTYFLRPKSSLQNLRTVSGWIDKRDTRIDSFIEKANRIIEKSREASASFSSERRSPTGLDGPVVQIDNVQLSFSPDDREIIRFLQASMVRQRFIQKDPYAAFVPSIVKRIKRYQPVDTRASGAPRTGSLGVLYDAAAPNLVFSFLKELGLYVPWDTLIAYGADGTEINRRGIEISPPGTTNREIASEERVRVLLNESAPLQGRDFFELNDGLDSIRHDFGDMPVYVVDDADAHELDDGVSVEPISRSDVSHGEAWVHVHVADPSALIHPRDLLAREAERLGLTTYFAERVSPMIPHSLVHSRLSLGTPEAVRPSGTRIAQPVLTLSLRVTQDGSLAESKVRVGVVRNFRVISYDAVDTALGCPLYGLDAPLSPAGPPARTLTTLDPEAVKDLELLRTISRNLMVKRYSDPGVTSWLLPTSEVRLRNAENLPFSKPHSMVPVFYGGFPKASLIVRTPNHESLARRMIGEFMIAAGAAAASFATDQKGVFFPMSSKSKTKTQAFEPSIPFIFRISPRSTASDEDLAAFVASRHPTSLDVDYTLPFKRHVIFGTSTYTAMPSPHAGMGTGMYARVTSPLRRFTDLVNHWQIKAGLRTTLLGGRADGKWPATFTKDMLQLIAAEHTHVERMSRRANKANQLTWAIMLIMRALQSSSSDAETLFMQDVLSSLDAVIMANVAVNIDTRSTYHDVFIPKLALNAELINVPSPGVGQIGDTVKVSVSHATMSMMPRLYVTLA